MKRHWILILVAVCIIGIIAGFLLTRKPEGFVAHAWSAVWAKQGQTLYYTDRDGKSWCFDTKTEEKRFIGKHAVGSDIFPDGKRQLAIISQFDPDISSLYISDIKTHKGHLIVQKKSIMIDEAYCLSNDKILFVEHPSSEYLKPLTTIANTNGRVLSKLHLKPEIVAMDGSSFIYEKIKDHTDKYFLYDINAKSNTKLNFAGKPYTFLYLSSKLVVYTFHDNSDEMLVGAMDLKSMKFHRLDWPKCNGMTNVSDEGRISPSLTKYWKSARFMGEYMGSKFYIEVIDIPKSTVKILKSIEGRK